MSVLIKGMEMPTKGYRLILVHADGTVQTASGETTAVSVPPHGRLIDADAMAELWKGCTIEGSIGPLLDTRPTVIEAEEGET